MPDESEIENLTFEINVKVTHHGADVRFEQPGVGDHQNQPEVKSFCPWYGQREVSRGDEDAAIPDGFLRAQNPIRKPASGQWRSRPFVKRWAVCQESNLAVARNFR